jgi:energy-coupling factor transporter transmembrane protein EcfT
MNIIMINICPPALVYILFTITQILIDIYKEKVNEPFQKSITGVIVTALLIFLCKKGFINIAWIIVLVPFILMIFIIGLLIYVLGYDFSTGDLSNRCENIYIDGKNKVTIDGAGNILIYNPKYDEKINPVYYNNPYIVVPTNKKVKKNYTNLNYPIYSSSPMYQS